MGYFLGSVGVIQLMKRDKTNHVFLLFTSCTDVVLFAVGTWHSTYQNVTKSQNDLVWKGP